MKEGYAGLIGASSPTFKGTPKSMKAYPMSLEPLWACGDCSASPQALRAAWRQEEAVPPSRWRSQT